MQVLEVLVGLTAILVVCLNVLVFVCYRRLRSRLSAEINSLGERVSSTVDAGAKLNEVRDFYEHAEPELQRLLNEAHREGDRKKQDRFRKLVERLNTLKARTVDRSARLLDPEGEGSSRRKRRRRPRRRSSSSSSRKSNGPPSNNKGGGPDNGGPRNQ